MRRIGFLLAAVLAIVIATATPSYAQGSTQGEKAHAENANGHAHETETTAGTAETAPAATNSGNGMNRQGGPSTHPGNGWKDPGQDQGSPANTADPDCTGNRTTQPQATNIGACDTPTGAADKPGGTGGFNADRDWNNGCGNDTDFEDDNNGRCRGPVHAAAVGPQSSVQPTKQMPQSPPTPRPTKTAPSSAGSMCPVPQVPVPQVPVPQGVVPPVPVVPMVPSVAIVTPTPPPAPSLELPLTPDVAAESPPASAPPASAIVRQPPELALTGGSSTDLVTMAIGLMAIGTVLTRLRPRRR